MQPARVGVLPNLEKEDALQLAGRLIAWLAGAGHVPVYPPEVAALLSPSAPEGTRPGHTLPLEGWRGQVAFAVVLGGDGTLLKAARQLAPLDVPLVGVNLGRLGFLTELEAEGLFEALPAFLAGEYVVDERAMLAAWLHRPAGVEGPSLALNDVVVSMAPFGRLGLLAVHAAGSHLGTYPADGIIVATPTGSTAYSLSAGGPILHPGLDLLVITPICPHTFYARPTVIPKGEPVRIRPVGRREGVSVTLDGQERFHLAPGDEVEVRVADSAVRLMRRPGWDFYQVLHQKLAEENVQSRG